MLKKIVLLLCCVFLQLPKAYENNQEEITICIKEQEEQKLKHKIKTHYTIISSVYNKIIYIVKQFLISIFYSGIYV